VGLCFTGNYLAYNDYQKDGVPRSFIYRALIASYSLEQAVKICANIPRSSAENQLITSLNRQIDTECSATDFGISEVQDIYAHTNHYIIHKMLKYVNYPPSRASMKRLERVNHLLKQNYGQLNVDMIKRIIEDHGYGDKDSAICVHGPMTSTIFNHCRIRNKADNLWLWSSM